MVRAVFLDIDGTLRDERQGVPDSAKKAIRMCRESGIQIVICTGRNMASIQPDVKAIQVDGIIAGGGSLIQDGKTVWKDTHFQYEEMNKALNYVTACKLPLALESQERIFMNQAAAQWFKQDFERKLKGLKPEERKQQRKANGICYEDTLKDYRMEHDRIHKICIWSPGNGQEGAVPLAETIGSIAQQGARDGWWYLEVLPKGCSKGAAIREWCGLKHIDIRHTISFGDGKNDIDMLQATGTGIAMENGDEELKLYASSVCGTAMEDGIYREMVRLGMI